jgi:hypothetical protein
MFGNVFRSVGNAFKKAGDVVEDAGEAVGGVFQKGAGAMGDAVGGAADVAGGVVKGGVDLVGDGAEALADVGKGGFDATKYLASEGWHAAEKAASASGQAMVFVGREGFELGRDAGDALTKGTLKGASWVLNQVEAGRRKLGEWGTDLVGRAFGRRAGDVFGSLYDRGTGWVTGAAQNVVEGADTIRQGAHKVLKGKVGEGLRDIGEGVVKIGVQTPVDAAIVMGAGAIGAVQSLLGIDPPSRELTGEEIAELRKVFGDSVDYSQVRIKEGDGGFWGGGGLFTIGGRPRSVMGTIYIPSGYLEKEVGDEMGAEIADRITAINTDREARGLPKLTEAEAQAERDRLRGDEGFKAEVERKVRMTLLVHEVTHVWQYQNGGSDYMGEAVWAQYARGGYDLRKAAGKPWHRLSPELQGALLEEAYEDGFFDDPPQNVTKHGIDFTAQVEEALKQVRSGEGAP